MFQSVKYHSFYIYVSLVQSSVVSIKDVAAALVVDDGAVVRLVRVVGAARGEGGEEDLVPLVVVVHVLGGNSIDIKLWQRNIPKTYYSKGQIFETG